MKTVLTAARPANPVHALQQLIADAFCTPPMDIEDARIEPLPTIATSPRRLDPQVWGEVL